MQRTKGFAVQLMELILILVLGLVSPYFSILIPWYLGILVLESKPAVWRLTLGPAVGIGIVIVTAHLVSLLRLPLWMSVPAVYFITLLFWFKRPSKASLLEIWKNISSMDRLFLSLSVFLSAGIKAFFLQVPAYSSAPRDPIFHAYKAWEILREETIFIRDNPLGFSGFLTYPAGYHALISWVSLASRVEVPFAMEALKLFTWVFIPLGSYIAAKELFGNENTARASAIVAPLTYLYYYYLHYSLLHMFLAYYVFLAAVTVYTHVISKQKKNEVSLGDLSILVLVALSLLLIHPYVYLLFQAFALSLLFVHLIHYHRQGIPAIRTFFVQVLGSYLGYYILEYPNRLKVERYTKPIFNSPGFAFKDNPHWLAYILKQTFWDNGQFVFLPFFVLGVALIFKRKSKNGMALLLTVLFDFFLIFDKLWFHINIPFYAAIWNSERIYILLAPVFPLIVGYGISGFLEVFSLTKKSVVAFVFLLTIPGLYVNVDNYSRELCSTVDESALLVFNELKTIGEQQLYVPDFKDSGYWIPLFTGKQIKRVSTPPSDGILYIDSRGFGDIKIEPINPLTFLNKKALVIYHDGIWVFNLSKPANASNPEAIKELYRALRLRDNIIDASSFDEWKHFGYGFLLRHPVVVKGILLKEWNGVFSRANESYIVFVSDRDYSHLKIVGLGDNTKVYLDGKYIGTLNDEPAVFQIEITRDRLHVLKFEGEVYIEKVILQC